MAYKPFQTAAEQGLLDAFSNQRVSTPTFVSDGQLTYNLAPLIFEQLTNGSGATITHDTTNRCATMAFSSTPTGGYAYMQSFEHFRYQAGRAQEIFVTFNFTTAVANVLKFAGYSDGTNGIEFQNNGTVNQFTIYSTSLLGNDTVTQANWNLDPMNGSGPSGITLDITKTQILVIDLQALYVGRVRCGFDINGMIVWAHEFDHANIAAYPYFQSANLPIRCGMSCTGTVSTTMDFICHSVMSRSGQSDPAGFNFVQTSSVTAASGVKTHALSLRPKTTFNSITNRSKFDIEGIEILVTGANPVYWELCLGQAISGTTTYNDVNATYSAVEYNTAGTASGSAAIVITSGFCGASATVKGENQAVLTNRYPLTLNAAGAVRSLGTATILVTGLGGASACQVAVKWKEIR